MKINELIKILQDIDEKNPDLDVLISDRLTNKYFPMFTIDLNIKNNVKIIEGDEFLNALVIGLEIKKNLEK